VASDTAETGVRLWKLPLDLAEEERVRLQGFLSASELDRAMSYRRDPDQLRAIIGRGFVREMLGKWIGCDPQAVNIALSPAGKPFVEGKDAPGFNVSHSGDWILVVLNPDGRVGVDVEVHREVDQGALARACFSEQEKVAWRGLPPDQRTAAFFEIWSRKEAYLKATGTGLRSDLPAISVPVGHLGGSGQIADVADSREARRWRVFSVDIDPQHAAAIVCPVDSTKWSWGAKPEPIELC